MCGMLVLGSGGGLLNGETQKAIMSVVPRERAGMASGIRTTLRYSGILQGFAVLSGILATAVRDILAANSCQGPCRQNTSFADGVVAGDRPHAIAGLTPAARVVTIEQARSAFSGGFSAALLTAGLIAVVSALGVFRLMRNRRGGRNVGDLIMDGKKPLHLPRRLETLQDPLSSPGRLVAILRPVVEAFLDD